MLHCKNRAQMNHKIPHSVSALHESISMIQIYYLLEVKYKFNINYKKIRAKKKFIDLETCISKKNFAALF